MWPYVAVCALFWSKVDSILDMGRWLLILVPNAQDIIDQAYVRWSRILLGVDWWRNAAACTSEMGFTHSGFARVVYAVAIKRAKLWLRGENDWHARFFFAANAQGCGWAACSALLLSTWQLQDWPEWAVPGTSLDSYRSYVLSVLSRSYLNWWSPTVLLHRAQVPYGQFVISPGASIRAWRGWSFSAAALSGMRSFCRLRCGQLTLRHLNGVRSTAHFQRCIFCDERTRNATVHCLASCRQWSQFRPDLRLALNRQPEDSLQELARCALRADSIQVAEVMCKWAAEVDWGCYQFWQER